MGGQEVMIRKMKEFFFSSTLFIFVKSLELKLPKLHEPLMLTQCEMETLTSNGWTRLRATLDGCRCCHSNNSSHVWGPLPDWKDPLDISRG